jgi:DNA modification methylase
MATVQSEKRERDDFSGKLEKLFSVYRFAGKPISVNFRELVPYNSGVDRYTHLIHPYPAKLLFNIPYFFLRCEQIAPEKATVLDPFCGSGTVLLEAILAGHRALGADSNPLARLITRAKTRKISRNRIDREFSQIERRASSASAAKSPDVVNIDHWFTSTTIRALSKIARALEEVASTDLRDFFNTCFSATVRKVSLADPRNVVPVRISPERARRHGLIGWTAMPRRDVGETFRSIVAQNADRIGRLPEEAMPYAIRPILQDARTLALPKQVSAADLIITSPPYTGAQKYIRASSLSLGWLGLAKSDKLRTLEQKNIGREHYRQSEMAERPSVPIRAAKAVLDDIAEANPLRAHIASTYLWEMKEALEESYRVLSPGAHMVLVAGANLVCGRRFDTPTFLERLANKAGFRTRLRLSDDIRSRGLMTKRNRTAGIISVESVLILRKPL